MTGENDSFIPSRQNVAGARILLVDDDNIGREILTAQLEEAGYCVSSARNGREAYDWAGISAPDLIVTDVLMPELDGFGLCRKLRENEATRQIPVIFYTGEFLAPEDEQLAFTLGVVHYLIKPQDEGVLLDCIAETLQTDHGITDVTRMMVALQTKVPQQHLDRVIHQLNHKFHQLTLTNKRLTEVDARYRGLLERAPDAIVISDEHGIITYINQQAKVLTGYTSEELVGQVVELLVPNSFTMNHIKQRHDFINSSIEQIIKRKPDRFKLRHKTGELIPVEINLSKLPHDNSCEVTAIIRDVRETVAAEKEIRSLNRLYNTLSQCNQDLIHAQSEQAVLDSFCNTLVDVGGFRLAWVGFGVKTETSEAQGRPFERLNIAARRIDGRLTGNNDIIKSEALFDCHSSWHADPVCNAINTMKPQIIHFFDGMVDHFSDGQSLWKKWIEKNHIQLGVSLPLIDASDTATPSVIGVLNIYRTEKKDFSDKEMALIEELAKDLSYGILTLRGEQHRKQIESELFLHQRALSASINGVILTDAVNPEHPIVYANPAFLKMTGYSLQEVLGRSPRFLYGEELNQEGVEELKICLRHQKPAVVVVKNFRKDGTAFWNDTRIAPVLDDHGMLTHYVGIANDISELMGYQHALEFQANHDALTGLANRNLLKDRLSQALRTAKRNHNYVAILFLDLDRFKLINDSLGHEAGDTLLIELGKRFSDLLREEDSIARWGGDEFVIILPDLNEKSVAMSLMAELLKAIRRSVTLKGRTLTMNGSIGCSLYPHDADTADALIGQADSAMYRAKELGGDTWQFFSDSMNASVKHRLDIEMDLRVALENDQFELFYQPQIKISSGEIVGAEALIRWRHPQKGLVLPNDFIPIAEEVGLIRDIGLWVFKEAGAQLKRWQDKLSPRFTMAVNVSYYQFTANDFLQQIHDELEVLGVQPEQMELELTERIMMKDVDWILAQLNKAKSMGLKLSIDDFGTGYSSLSYLQHFPADRLKIDQSFIADLPFKQDAMAITLAIIRMAHAMRYEVVAEGVETNAQLESLWLQGCDLVQGYLFSPPLPVEGFGVLLDKNDFQTLVRAMSLSQNKN